MSDGAPNPFQKLARDFAEKQKTRASAPGGKARSHSSAAAPQEPSPDQLADNALFLSAMSRIKPLAAKGGNSAGRPLAEALAERMRGNPATPAGKAPPPRQEAQQHRSPPARDAQESEHAAPIAVEDDHAVMQALLDGKSAASVSAPVSSDDADAFAKAMRGVVPVAGKGREIAAPAASGGSLPVRDAAQALRDLLEGKVEFALHHIDEYMEGFVVGVDPLVIARLRAGQYSPEAHLDLHGMNARQAHDALIPFVKNSYQKGLRTLVVITGRGRNSPDGVGILRPMLQRWLCREPFKRVVLAFCTAKAHDGGPGAVYVLLRKYKKSRGKIVWEHTPSDEDFPEL